MSNVGIYGNGPHCPSGYGTQADKLGRELRKNGHQVAYMPFHGLQGSPLGYEGSTIYPGSTEDPWALDLLGAHYRHFGADLLITLMDAWVLDPAKLAGMNIAHWLPVDCEPLGAMDRRVLDAGGGRPVAMSRFGLRQMQDAGYDALLAPHSLPMDVWSPLTDRQAARESLGFGDRFIVAVNAANQDPFRKGYGEQLAAFAQLAKRHDDVLMLIHTRAETRNGINLAALIADLGLEKHVVIGDQYLISAGMIGEGQMVSWHGIADLLTNCSYGEGFGLAVLQSQATGTPVVVTDFSAMSELCGAGWKVGGQRFWNRGHDARWKVPYIHEIADAYELAYDGGAARLRDQAREFALAYDSAKIYREHWAPILAELCPEATPVVSLPEKRRESVGAGDAGA
ncbi:MAG TPA: glycosyltransferase [Streptosporangiaceae bacterium]|nr:glycosyltransferase [Streptosporangiaceae bacterium]